MAVQNGNPVEAGYTNSKLMSRSTDTGTTGKVYLNNTTDPNSGSIINNTQRAVNETFETVGMTGEGDATRKDYSSNNVVTNGDSHKVAIGKLDAKAALLDADIATVAGDLATHVADVANPHAVTKTQVGLGNVTDDAQLKRAAGDFNTFTEKVTPVDDDIVLIEDSENGFIKKKAKLSELLGGGGVAYQEIPTGVVNGSNAVFGPLTYLPSDDNSVLVMIDFVAVPLSGYTVVGPTITFQAGWIPQLGQSVYAFYNTGGTPALPPMSGTLKVEYRTITALEITNKQMTLVGTPNAPNEVQLDFYGGSIGWVGDDFTVSSNVLGWTGLGMDGLAEEGDKVRITYVI